MGSLRSAQATTPPPALEKLWRQWMAAFGRHVRRVREFLGLSQAELARRSGVSQGAVSRFESGRGLNAPFVVILRMNMALADASRAMDPSLLDEDVREFLRYMELLPVPETAGVRLVPGGTPLEALRLTPEAELERVGRLYRRLPDPARRAIVAALEAYAAAAPAA